MLLSAAGGLGPPAGSRVPGVVAVGPGKAGGEGGEEVEEGPGDENVVVDADVKGQHQHTEPDPLKEGTDVPDLDGTLGTELAGSHLEEEDRDAHQNQRQDVGNQESSCNSL